MGMFRARIHVKAAVQLVTQPVLGQHAADGVFYEPLRMLPPDHSRRLLPLTAGISSVSENHPVSPLLARHPYFGRINDDYVITAIHMGRITGLVLSTDNVGYPAGQTAQHLRACIHNHPTLLYLGFVELCRLVTVVIHSIILNVNTKSGHF